MFKHNKPLNRSQLMLSMARRTLSRENVVMDGGVNQVSNIVSEEQSVSGERSSMENILNDIEGDGCNAENETDSIFRATHIEMPTASTFHSYNDCRENEQEMVEDEEFDDSDKDPNYHPTNSSYDKSDLEEMGLQIEEKLMEVDVPVTEKVDTRASRQLKRNKGKSYITEKNKFIKDREFKPIKDCRRKCVNKISIEKQKKIFENYWKLGQYNLRLMFVSGLIEVKNTKTTTLTKNKSSPRNRTHTSLYHLEINHQREQVCQNCFRTILGETNRFLKTVIKKKLESNTHNTSIQDNRGNHSPKHKLSGEKIQEIKDHINLFPAYESHYSRKRSSQKYLQADLTLTKMYELYTEKNSAPASLSKYREIFHTIGIKFKKPKIDTCNKCDTFASKLTYVSEIEKIELEIELEQKKHHDEADFAYTAKSNDKILAETNPKLVVATFDLQQCLPNPFLLTSVSFYKRQLWTFNLTVHNCVSNVPYCFLWNETIARRGGNEIASCLFQYLKYLPSNTEQIIFYSDSCAGQNKNSFVAIMFHLSVMDNKNINIIDHKFLEPGHTHMECDVDHATIERKKKTTSYKIHHPRDWSQFIRSLSTKTKFTVHDMNREEFFNFSMVVKNKFNWRNVDTSGNRFIWKDVKWLRYTKDFGTIQYKTTLNDEEPFKILNITKRGVNKFKLSDLTLCYSENIKISIEKKRDLLDLLPLIDPVLHNFYENLSTIGSNEVQVQPNINCEDEESTEDDE